MNQKQIIELLSKEIELFDILRVSHEVIIKQTKEEKTSSVFHFSYARLTLQFLYISFNAITEQDKELYSHICNKLENKEFLFLIYNTYHHRFLFRDFLPNDSIEKISNYLELGMGRNKDILQFVLRDKIQDILNNPDKDDIKKYPPMYDLFSIKQLKRIIDGSSEIELCVIILRWGLINFNPLSCEEVSNILNITSNRVIQIEAKILWRSKKHPKKIEPFLT